MYNDFIILFCSVIAVNRRFINNTT